jgi:heme oxygenase (mycobilin-producing)
MIVSMFRVTVPTEAIAPFERSWRQRAGKVDAMPGFRGLEVLRAGATPGKYIVLTRWETREDFDRWASSPEFTSGHARTGDTGAEGGSVEFYEVLPS